MTASIQTNHSVTNLLQFSFGRKLPVILQTEAAECGLSCLAMIAGFHGLETDLTTLRRRFSISAHGATLKQIIDIASQLNLSSRALKLDLDQLPNLQMPCVLHWEMKHFVVLKQVKDEGVIIHDPAVGERKLSLSEVDKLFTGVALELTPNSEFTPEVQKQTLRFSHFWQRIVGLKRSLGLILLLSFLLQVFAIASPYYMQTVVDDVILRQDHNLLLVLAIGFGLLLLIDTFTTYIRRIVVLNLSSSLNLQMSANVFHHLIRLPLDYFLKRHMGDVVSRFGSLATIRELMTNGIVAVVVDGVMAIIVLLVMFFYDVQLTFIVMGIVALYALLRFLLYRPIHLLNEERIVASAKENSHFMESVRAIQTIKLFGKETDRQCQCQNKLADAMNKDIQLNRWEIAFEMANKVLFGLENILIMYFAATAVMGNLMSVGMLFAFISYKARFIGSMDVLIAKWIEFKMLKVHFERLADVVFTEQDENIHTETVLTVAAKNNDTNNQTLSGSIELKAITYQYSPLEAPIFSDLDLKINAGETVAIIGASGCGKSTLIRCLMGLVKPTSGEILIDEKPISQIPDFRQQISGVLQDDQLLSGSIAENIACFNANIDLQRVVMCAQLACIHEEIIRTSMQYNTLVGDMGTSLSGGQKQRILLARAFYKQPKILFMDEATSHLDVANEMQINAHIKQLKMTRIVIAHRPETINSADRVLMFQEGKLVQVKQTAIKEDE
ncbi:MAG: ATP-binding cassette domain-containing protein [Alteromonadaceae bacterium]|nr:ATP-binding cassette domain-containing protein [Alteromonadaceae bacterium]